MDWATIAMALKKDAAGMRGIADALDGCRDGTTFRMQAMVLDALADALHPRCGTRPRTEIELPQCNQNSDQEKEAMRTLLTMRADIEIEIDPKNPTHMMKATQWMNEIAEGKISAPDESLGAVVSTRKAPELIRRAEG